METLQGSEPQFRLPGKAYPVTALGYPGRLIGPETSYDSVSDQIAGAALRHPHQKVWFVAFTGAFTLFLVFCGAISYLLYRGVGIWGINIPVAWAFAIVNFVWW